MHSNRNLTGAAATLFAAVAALILAACASMGRPEGGPRDTDPPVFVRSNPMPGATGVARQRIDLWFDENIQLEDAFNKVVVSPAQSMAPVVRSLGRHATVELRDTLVPNATYTIDFGDAIKDLNEGNLLDGFAMDFATGPSIDTLRISGTVLAARNLEPAQGITVGVYLNPTDSTVRTRRFDRIARTNSLGQFTVRGLKPGRYSVYAVNDLNRDNRIGRDEDQAFADSLVSPLAMNIEVNDTLRSHADEDSVVTRPGVAFLPDDVLLLWFNEGYSAHYIKDYKRPERRKITLTMAAPSPDSLPQLTFASGSLKGQPVDRHALLQRNEGGDTLTYWLRSPEALANDSILMSVRHLFTDSAQQVVWKTDTLKYFWREPKKKKDAEADSIAAARARQLDLRVATSAKHEIYQQLMLTSPTPLLSADTAAFRLEMQVDTLWRPATITTLRPYAPNPLLAMEVVAPLKAGTKYRLTVDSAAVADIYGAVSNPITHEFTVKTPEEYSNLTFKLSGFPDSVPAVVELLGTSDNVVMTAPVASGKADLHNITPGTYYARIFLDTNNNGKWDTGNTVLGRQPEEVAYYHKRLELRPNWDVNQDWNIYDKPIDRQKPSAIKKNKPKGINANDTGVEDGPVYDEWGNEIAPDDPRYERYKAQQSKQNNNRNNRSGNRNSSTGNFRGMGGLGGLQQMGRDAGTLR